MKLVSFIFISLALSTSCFGATAKNSYLIGDIPNTHAYLICVDKVVYIISSNASMSGGISTIVAVDPFGKPLQCNEVSVEEIRRK